MHLNSCALNCDSLDIVFKFHEFWNVDNDGEEEGGEEVAPRSLLERHHRPGAPERLVLVHEERVADGQIPGKRKERKTSQKMYKCLITMFIMRACFLAS